jgi:integrase/recombinase XerD
MEHSKRAGSYSVDTAIQDFLFHCQYEKNLSEKTITAYTIDLEQLSAFLRQSYPVDSVYDIDKHIVKEYMRHLSGFKTKTIKRKIASLKAMFNYLGYENDDFINPFHKIKICLREANVLPTVMSISEVRKILSRLYDKERTTDKTLYSYRAVVRDIAIVELLFATGVRVSELCSLKTTDVNLREGYIKVFGKGSKERFVQLCGKETKAALKNYSALFKQEMARSGYFFINRIGQPLTAQSVRLMIRDYVNDAGLDKNITPHTFRHTFATLLLEENVDIRYIQNMLGHSSITTTQIYTHVNMETQKKILRTKHPRRHLNFLTDEDAQ